ncbi:MAG: hypothetical protein J6B03_08280 [Candidatus Homeothermus sp.]|nr:hypothetical protein [Candidatus Homeothermus sp.]
MMAEDLESLLSGKINIPEIRMAASLAVTAPENRAALWSLAHSGDRRTSANALWVMTHLPASEAEWLHSLQDELIDMLLAETDTGKKRMLLQLLKVQDYAPDDIRTDFLDFCMSKINSECEAYAVRCFSIYTAFHMCRHFPELIAELEQHLDMMSSQSLSPGLKSALRQTKAKIARLRPVQP